jgi:hypothetical protein
MAGLFMEKAILMKNKWLSLGVVLVMFLGCSVDMDDKLYKFGDLITEEGTFVTQSGYIVDIIYDSNGRVTVLFYNERKGIEIENDHKFSRHQRWAVCVDENRFLWVFSSDVGSFVWVPNAKENGEVEFEKKEMREYIGQAPNTLREFIPSSLRRIWGM